MQPTRPSRRGGLPGSFNPHRPFRAGATSAPKIIRPSSVSFNPHRPFRAGATPYCQLMTQHVHRFNPHRPFRAGATNNCGRSHRLGTVSILTGPFGPVQPIQEEERRAKLQVSILTGPFGPVQLDRLVDEGVRANVVSILTGPFGPVQRDGARGQGRGLGFNPHRPFRAGATPSIR